MRLLTHFTLITSGLSSLLSTFPHTPLPPGSVPLTMNIEPLFTSWPAGGVEFSALLRSVFYRELFCLSLLFMKYLRGMGGLGCSFLALPDMSSSVVRLFRQSCRFTQHDHGAPVSSHTGGSSFQLQERACSSFKDPSR